MNTGKFEIAGLGIVTGPFFLERNLGALDECIQAINPDRIFLEPSELQLPVLPDGVVGMPYYVLHLASYQTWGKLYGTFDQREFISNPFLACAHRVTASEPDDSMISSIWKDEDGRMGSLFSYKGYGGNRFEIHQEIVDGVGWNPGWRFPYYRIEDMFVSKPIPKLISRKSAILQEPPAPCGIFFMPCFFYSISL